VDNDQLFTSMDLKIAGLLRRGCNFCWSVSPVPKVFWYTGYTCRRSRFD